LAQFIRQEAETDPAVGCRPAERPLTEYLRWGVVLLDKPAGLTSRRAAQAVARLLGVGKVGHGGTLDPGVTGVLPLLLGRSTRVAELFLGSDKAYVGKMRLHADVSDGALAAALERFRGVIEQLPPVRSSVKRQLREREVYSFEVTRRQGRCAEFAVECQGGTYIRKLVHDLGLELGCGAHMVGLRRTRAGRFGVGQCVTTEQVAAAARLAPSAREAALRRLVRPVEELIAELLPCVRIGDGAVHSVCTGYPLAVPGVSMLDRFGRGDRVAVLTLKGELVGIGHAALGSEDIMGASRGEAVRVDRVLMDRDAYPPWRRGED